MSETDQQFYQELSGRAAKGVAVISAFHRGRDHAAVVTDYLSVSYDPPTMAVGLYSLSRLHEAVEESGRWALSLLSSGQASLADRLSEPGAPLIGLLDHIPHWRREDGSPPLIDGALAWFELRTSEAVPAATHTLFVGEVVHLARPAQHAVSPLVRYRSGYLRLPSAAGRVES